MPKREAPSTLSGKAASIWKKVYAKAWKSYDPDKHTGTQEAYASKIAWTAVKGAGYTKDEKTGKWVKTKALHARFRLRITKARADATGRIKWHAQAASDEMDAESQEVLHPSLFDDLAATFLTIRAAYDEGSTPPAYWFGDAQEPILELSHYSSLLPPESRDAARVGSLSRLYRDGNFLHAEGYFDDTELGKLVSQAVLDDDQGHIRVSVGFWPDWGNILVRNDVLHFLGGREEAVLDHLAVTSVPRLQATSIHAEEVLTMSDGAVTTMAEDVEAILGEGGEVVAEHLEELATEAMETQSMVCMSDEGNGDPDEVAPDADEPDVVVEEVAVEQPDVEHADAVTVPVEASPEEVEPTPDPDPGVVTDAEPEEAVESEAPPEAEPVVAPEVVVEAEPMVVESDAAVDDEPWAEIDIESVAWDPNEHQDEAELVVQADTSQRDKDKAAQKARSKKYGIAVTKPTHVTKPAKWSHLKDSQFADPVNYRYPVHDQSHANNAASRFAQEKKSYTGKGKVGKRIKAAQKKFGTKAVKSVAVDEMVIESCGCAPPGTAVVVVAPLGGATTFDEAIGYHEARKEAWRLGDGWHLLQTVMNNIMEDVDADNKAAMIEVAVRQFLAFVKSDQEIYSDAEADTDAPDVEETPTESVQPVEAPVVKDVPVTEADTVSEEEQAIAERIQQLAATGIPDAEIPTEVAPMAVVESPVVDVATEDVPVVPASYRKAGSFSAALDALQVQPPRPVQRMSRVPSVAQQQQPVAPSPTGTVEYTGPPVGEPTDLRNLVRAEIQETVTPVLEEIVAQLQTLSASVSAVNDDDGPPPVTRRSQSSLVQAPRVVTQARTFGEVVDQLGANRNRLLRGR